MKAPSMMHHQGQQQHPQSSMMAPASVQRGQEPHQTASEVKGHQPDLSHLTMEERQIIESVMMRQRQEEEEEAVVLK